MGDGLDLIVVAIVAGIICGLIGSAIAGPGRSSFGFWVSFLLGPLGLLIVAITRSSRPPAVEATHAAPSSRATKRCPECAEDIMAEARKCRFCGADVTAFGAEASAAPRPTHHVCTECGRQGHALATE